jgi:hypothetical protein
LQALAIGANVRLGNLRPQGNLISDGSRGVVREKRFANRRYGADIGKLGRRRAASTPSRCRRMDSIEGLGELREVGRAMVRHKVRAEPCARFPAAA